MEDEGGLTARRREMLMSGVVAVVTGASGCLRLIEPSGTPTEGGLSEATFDFDYREDARELVVEYTGGGALIAGNVHLQNTDGVDVPWPQLGTTTTGSEETLSAGATAVLGGDVLNWSRPVDTDDTIRVVYVDGGSPSTLEKYEPASGSTTGNTTPGDEETAVSDRGQAGIWLQHQHDALNTGSNTAGTGGEAEPSQQWTFQTDREVRGGPAVRGENLFFTSKDGNLYKLGRTSGEERWRYETGGTGFTSPALWNDLVLFTSSADDALFAVDVASGSEVWRFGFGDACWRSPTVAGGVAYVGSNDENFYAVDVESGTELWRHSTGGAVLSVPAVTEDRVVFTSRDDNLYCVDRASGSEVWSVTASNGSRPLIGTPTVVSGTVIQSGRDGPQRAYDLQDGALRWETDVPGGGERVYEDVVLYAAGEPGSRTLRAADPVTGTVQWTVDGAAAGNITGDVLYYSRNEGRFGAVDLTSRSRLWETQLPTSIRGSPVAVDGWLYLSGADGQLYAFR